MAKKVSEQEFLTRFYRSFPDTQITPIGYTAISKPVDLQCMKCRKIIHYHRARDAIKRFPCCGRPNPLLKSNSLEMLAAQNELNEMYDGDIEILEYNGPNKQNLYRCHRCGMIFKRKQENNWGDRGCPKCDRSRTLGDEWIRNILTTANLTFKEHVTIPDFPYQTFDFALYNKDGTLASLIEVREMRDGYENDNARKKAFCRENNISLIEYHYTKRLMNLLKKQPLSSTTIPAKGSTPQA